MEQQEEKTEESLVTLCVGGKLFMTTMETLRTQVHDDDLHLLRQIFANEAEMKVWPKDQHNRLFFDRHWKQFHYILQYLRDKDCYFLKHMNLQALNELALEADYFLLNNLSNCIQKAIEQGASTTVQYLKVVSVEGAQTASCVGPYSVYLKCLGQGKAEFEEENLVEVRPKMEDMCNWTVQDDMTFITKISEYGWKVKHSSVAMNAELRVVTMHLLELPILK